MIIVSACLAGVNTRYDGGNRKIDELKKLVGEKEALPMCPETLGGLKIPRPPAEIVGGDGEDVIKGAAKVIDKEGKDVTAEFLEGAKMITKAALRMGIKAAVLKSKSGSCGCGRIYDGTFTKTLHDGDGVLTAMLKREGIRVYTEDEFLQDTK